MGKLDEFSFEQWATLARLDPPAFELRRREVIERFLRDASARKSGGEALQREIDATRKRASSPQEALVAITGMLRAQLDFLGEGLEALGEDLHVVERTRARLLEAATLIAARGGEH